MISLLLDCGADFRIHNKHLKTPLAYSTAEQKNKYFLWKETTHVVTLKDLEKLKRIQFKTPQHSATPSHINS